MKGVSRTRHGTFQTRISMNGKVIHLGSFKTEEEAGRAYAEARAGRDRVRQDQRSQEDLTLDTKRSKLSEKTLQQKAREADAELRKLAMLPLAERERIEPIVPRDVIEAIVSGLGSSQKPTTQPTPHTKWSDAMEWDDLNQTRPWRR